VLVRWPCQVSSCSQHPGYHEDGFRALSMKRPGGFWVPELPGRGGAAHISDHNRPRPRRLPRGSITSRFPCRQVPQTARTAAENSKVPLVPPRRQREFSPIGDDDKRRSWSGAHRGHPPSQRRMVRCGPARSASQEWMIRSEDSGPAAGHRRETRTRTAPHSPTLHRSGKASHASSTSVHDITCDMGLQRRSGLPREP
jgi:hypothetical protein